mmetsp:Transcript_33039/g.77967  ORF Transcript_33039/g.77967 Transcript_33039/m.77967 type:complete len:540 (+) Transcript_33039:47-1666(+)
MVAPSFRGLRLPLWIVLLTATLSSSPSEAWILPGGGGTARLFSEFQSGGCLRRCGFSTLAGCRKGLPLRDSALGMAMDAGGLTIAVQHVLESAMVGSCEKRKCVGSLGSVSCAWNGERKKDGEADEPLAKTRHLCGVVEHADGDSHFKVGDVVIAPATHGTAKGSKVEVAATMAVLKPKSFTEEQACLLPVLSLLFLQAMKTASVDNFEDLAGERVLVTGGTSPVGSLAIQILAGVGARVAATGSGSGQEKELRALGADTVIDYKKHVFFEEVQDLVLVVDALGSGRGSEGPGLRSEGVMYGPLMHPAVALILEEGMLFGGMKLKKFSGKGETVCEWTATEEGMKGVGRVAALMHQKEVKPHYTKDAFTPAEWMEAIGWPKDVDTGGRFGFPGKNLWNDGEVDEALLPPKIDFSSYEEVEMTEEQQQGRSLVQTVGSGQELQQLLQPRATGQFTLVEFHSPFCRACRGMRPRFNKLPKKMPSTQFLSIDVKAQKELASELAVDDVPAYMLFDGTTRKAKWSGVFRADELEFFAQGGGIA